MANFIPFGEPGLFDEFIQTLDVAAFETPLLRVGKLVRWEQFEPELLAAVLPALPKGPGGRPRFSCSKCSSSSPCTASPMTPSLSKSPTATASAPSSASRRVEHVFAQMRGGMHALWQRCIGLARNTACIQLANLVYNMVRFEQIQRLRLTYAA